MLQPDTPAPDFSLLDADLETVTLADLRGHNVVICFYPKDNTPSCTLQAIEFSDLENEFMRHDTIVIGISRDDCMSHANFRDKHGLAVQLLADDDGAVCKQYGVWQEMEKDGLRRMGIVRSTFVIDRTGVVRLAQYNVVAKGHATEILHFIQSL